MSDIPSLDEVGMVFLAVTCESIIDDQYSEASAAWQEEAEWKALNALCDYFGPIAAARPSLAVDLDGSHIHKSEYVDGARCYAWQVSGDFTPEEWALIAERYNLWLNGRAVPEEFSPTLGIITEEGLVPAVSIHGTDEGWGYGGYEPQLCASFYVAIGLKE